VNARLLIEPQMVIMTCTAGAPSDFVEVQRCLNGGDGANSYTDFEIWDSALHGALAAATHNTVLIEVYELINERRHHPLWGNLKRRTSSPERRSQYQQDHHKIVAAVTDRDATAAEATMREHLLRVRRDIFGEPF
jgi:DNA-binding FadR family transcriptional regulator